MIYIFGMVVSGKKWKCEGLFTLFHIFLCSIELVNYTFMGYNLTSIDIMPA